MRGGKLAALVPMLTLCMLTPSASAVEPEHEVGGVGSKWFSGSLLQQTGENCTTLGEPRTETMVSGVGSYGGVKGVPVVNQRYYTAFLVSIPGDPCGPGSASVETDLVLPPHTVVDTTAPIRCFGEPSGSPTFQEITNELWSFDGYSGRYCPTEATPSALHSGALSFGFRPLASGQLFWIFVPVKSSAPLVGAGHSPPDGFYWLTDATGVYANPGLSETWANVFASPTGEGPFVYFAHDPAVPFWEGKASKGPPDIRNRVEFFANLYTAQKGGNLCWEILEEPGNSPIVNCKEVGGWSGTVAAGEPDLLQVIPGPSETGPGGGYVPVAFEPVLWGKEFKIVWRFAYSGGEAKAEAPFKTLPGPDSDGDGVPDISDECPSVKGTLPNGCMPPVQTDPDGDGVYGPADLCPTVNGMGSLNGCPGGIVPTPATPGAPTTATSPTVTTTVPLVAVLLPTVRHGRATAARTGNRVVVKTGLTVTCPTGAAPCAVTLAGTVSGAQARGASAAKAKPVTVGKLGTSVPTGRTLNLTLPLNGKGAALLKKHNKLKILLAGSARSGSGPTVAITGTITIAYPKAKSHH
jgi:hypothetical protein